MAKLTLTPAVAVRNGGVAFAAYSAIPQNDVAEFKANYDDQKIAIHLKNTSAATTATAVIVKGNGIQGVKDLEVTVETSSEQVVVVESGAYKNVSGTDKGMVQIKDKSTTNSGLLFASVVVLP